jgi:c-di-GMP-binding flagellar brake protein YcgR
MNKERRRFFRIDDSLGVSYHRMGSEEAKVLSEEITQGSGEFDYMSNFDNRIQTLLDGCRVQSPVAAELVDLINKKLNFVIQQVNIDTKLMQQITYSLRQVNISACGMAFVNEERLEQEQLLQLELMLQPSELKIRVLARVVACESMVLDEAQTEQQFFLRLNFEMIKADDQELLIQHIVKRQSFQFKKKRQELQFEGRG